MRKIVFFDVDGVLLSENSYHIEQLKDIVICTNCELILSSTWRLFKKGTSELKSLFRKYGMKGWNDSTPCLPYEPRWKEIKEWLIKNEVSDSDRIVILDDMPSAYNKFDDNYGITFILTNYRDGLTNKHVKFAIDALNF